MSDTLPAGAHRTNSSGNCSISGCPCRGWSAQETAVVVKEEKSEMSTKSACVLTGAATESAEDCSTHRHRIESHQPAAQGGGDDNEHSPLPWRTGGPYSEFVVSNVGNEPSVARATGLTRKEAEANARFIVECVNQHQSLVVEQERYTQLLTAAKSLIAMNNCNYGRSAMRERGGFIELEKAVEVIEQGSTSE